MTDTATLRAGQSSYTVAAHPSKKYGNPARVGLASSGVARSHWWVSLKALPVGAVVTEARFRVRPTDESWVPGGGGSFAWTLTLTPTVAWRASTLDYAHAPAAAAGTPVSLVKTSASLPRSTIWDFLVTDLVNAQLPSGGFYFQLTGNFSGLRYLRGFAAATNKPELLVTYVTTTPAPANLGPNGGAVSTRTPTFTWDRWAPGETGRRLQVSAVEDFSVVDYDSGLLASTDASISLVGSGYQLPADGTHAFARVLRNGPLGPSAWSPAAETWYKALPAPTLISPNGDVNDGTPPFLWSVTGGTQKAYRAQLLTADGSTRLWSNEQTSAATTDQPDAGLARIGDSGLARIQVTDTEVRVAAPGAPVWATAENPITLVTSGASVVQDLEVDVDLAAPWLTFRWTGTLPDEWALLDADTGAILDRFAGTASTADGSHFTRRYYAAAPNRPRRYQMAEVPNNVIGAGGNVVTVAPRARGLWLVDPATGVDVWILGRDELEATGHSDVVTSTPLDRGYDVVRETNLGGLTIPITGYFANAWGRLAQDEYDTLMSFKADGRPLRFVWALINKPVAAHSLTATPIRAGVSPKSQRWKVTGTVVQQGENDWEV